MHVLIQIQMLVIWTPRSLLTFTYYNVLSEIVICIDPVRALSQSCIDTRIKQERENDDYLLLFSFKGKILRN